nr:MAG TPA: hypothetical protein [Bacteriophage sp.]DAW65952.1 MAG TPA: hypothetical protein [Bacteriophage sp.]
MLLVHTYSIFHNRLLRRGLSSYHAITQESSFR